jgi:hypothetical protein
MRGRDGERGDAGKLRRGRARRLAALQIELARLIRRDDLIGRTTGFLVDLVDGGGIGIECDGHLSGWTCLIGVV